MEAKDILGIKYLPFARDTILARSITYIDGLKPVQRYILYSMYELGLHKDTKSTKKAARIVGDVIGKYSPHGDQATYEAACAMADSYEGNLATFIRGRGNLGKKWSNAKLGGIHAAKMRYSELGMTPLAKELFGGLKENAVDFTPNFDGTEKEPVMLPVSFPSCLVNMNKGIAVGLGSCMPSYTIENVCNAVAAYLEGTAKTDEEMAKLLGCPDFMNECRVHFDDAVLLKLYKTGKASLKCTATFHVVGNEIIVDSVPPTTTFENVMKQIRDYALSPDGKDIVDIVSNIGRGTKGIRIRIKNNTNIANLMKCLYAKTDLMDTISFHTQIIWKGLPEQCSVKKVIDHWIEFRDTCLSRMYKYHLANNAEQEHKLSTWEAIQNDLAKVIDILAKSTEEQAIQKLHDDYGLDDVQCDYLFGQPIRSICTDKAKKSIDKLNEIRAEVARLKGLIGDKKLRYAVIIEDLKRIAKENAAPRRSATDGLLNMELSSKAKREVPETLSTVFITKKGFIKAIDGAADKNAVDRFLTQGDELMCAPIYAMKNEHLLVYTYSGVCYKILIDNIESSRGSLKQYIWELVAERKDESPIFYVTRSGKYDGCFAIIYGSGRGRLVYTKDVSGKMKVYKNQFIAGRPEVGYQDTLMLLPYDRFVLVTARQKAAMGTLEYMKQFNTGSGAFKVTRITNDDMLTMVLDASNFEVYVQKGYIDTTKYQKGYPVRYGNDPISYLGRPVEEFEEAWAKFQAEQAAKKQAEEEARLAKEAAKAAANQ